MHTNIKKSENMVKVNRNGKKVEMVPPDGGWGYMICFSLIIVFVLLGAPSNVFGLIYNDFLNDIGEGSSGIAVMQAVSSCTISLAGIFTSAALKRYSLRQVGLVGAIIGSIGTLLQVITTNIYEVIIYVSIVSTALGILMPVVYTAFNTYFVTKRVYLLSMSKAIVGISYMVYPMLAKWLMDLYGFRGALAVLGALTLNVLLGVMVIHPVSWHLIEKIVEEEVDESNGNDYDSKIKISGKLTDQDKSNNNADTEMLSNVREQKPTSTLLVPINVRRLSSPTINVVSAERRPSMPSETYIEKENNVRANSVQNQLQAVSMLSIGSFENAILPEILFDDENKEMKTSIWQKFSSALDLKLLLDPVYLNIVLGMSAALFTEMMFTLLFPMMLFTIGFSADQVALSLSSYAAGDMVARFLLAGVSKFIPLKPRNIFFTGVLLSFSFRIVLNLVQDFYLTAAISAIIGVAKCLTHLTIPLILGDHVPIEKYPAAYGLFMLFFGMLNMILGPVVGIIRDITGSYKLTFDLLNCAFLVCIIGWTVEYVITRKKGKHNADQ